jgi:hypothetical protein
MAIEENKRITEKKKCEKAKCTNDSEKGSPKSDKRKNTRSSKKDGKVLGKRTGRKWESDSDEGDVPDHTKSVKDKDKDPAGSD